ncbi:MAG TPA: hypothetical protein VIK83_04040 [Coriobacteriia bacterium]
MAAPIDLNTPVLLGLLMITLLVLAFSGYVAVDSMRRRPSDYAGVGEGRWFYAVPQAVFFALFIGSRFAALVKVAPWLAFAILAVPLILAQQMAYLLRVVFPTKKRLELRLDAECALLREGGTTSPRVARRVAKRVKATAIAAVPGGDSTFFEPTDTDD